MFLKKLSLFAAAMLTFFGAAQAQTVVKDKEAFAKLSDSLDAYLAPVASIVVNVAVDSAVITGNNIDIHLTSRTSDYFFRDNTVKDMYSIAADLLPDSYTYSYFQQLLQQHLVHLALDQEN